jgi:tetratricopeptide (TPR) repeat protein
LGATSFIESGPNFWIWFLCAGTCIVIAENWEAKAIIGLQSFIYKMRNTKGAGIELQALHDQATALSRSQKHDDALRIATKALTIAEEIAGPNHLDVARTLNLLCRLQINRRQYQAAELYARRSLRITESALGWDHPEVRFALKNLSDCHVRQGQYSASLALLMRAHEITKEIGGAPSVQILVAIGQNYRSQGSWQLSETWLNNALTILKDESLPNRNSWYALVYENLADVYRGTDRPSKADFVIKIAEELRRKES